MNPSSADREEHLSDELVLRYIDDELREEERREVERHLEACTPCAERRRTLREASSRLSRGLRALDVPPSDPEPPAAMALDSRDRAARAAAPGESGREGVPAGRRRLLVAAMLLLTVTGIGLAAVPGSPVRDWIVRSAERATALFSSGDEDGTDVAAASAESAAGAVSVGSREERLVIALTDPEPAVVRLRLVRGERATVRAPRARYLAAPGRLEVVEARSGTIVLELPVDVSSARVEVDGRTVLVREDGELRFLVPSVDSAGSEFTFSIGGSDEP